MSDQTTVTSINDHDETTLETTTLVHVDIGEEAEFENGLDSSSTTGGMIQDEEPREESRKRTVISHDQRVILESFFNTGMKSASNSLKHLHEAAALQTGLDYYVVKVREAMDNSSDNREILINTDMICMYQENI